jgi:hypothetical protein
MPRYQCFADADEIALATRVATCQLNQRARPWVWAALRPRREADDGRLSTAFEERSTSVLSY